MALRSSSHIRPVHNAVTSQPTSQPLLSKNADIKDLLQRGYRYAYSLAHDQAAAEDILQDAWLALLKAGSARTPGYLFQAVRSRFIDRYRRERLVVITALDDAGEDSIKDEGESSAADAVIASDLLDRVLATLRAEEREVLYLSMVEGYTGQELADLTGRSSGAVRTLLHRVRAKVRHAVKQNHASEVSQ